MRKMNRKAAAKDAVETRMIDGEPKTPAKTATAGSEAALAGKTALWAARIALAAVFAMNVQCAIQFIIWPDAFAPAYELTGVAGSVAIQGIGVAFLMWNVTYPPAIIDPIRYRTFYIAVLVQQSIGFIGESAVLASIPEGHALLAASILRFAAFDGIGLIVMAGAFAALTFSIRRKQEQGADGDGECR